MSKLTLRLLIIYPFLLIALTSCSDFDPVPPPIIHSSQSSEPTFEIMVDLGDLQARAVTGHAFYNISNPKSCVKLDQSLALGGVRDSHSQGVALLFTKDTNGRFLATLNDHPFKDEDYYGMGVCHWTLSNIGLTLSGGVPEQHFGIISKANFPRGGTPSVHNNYCAAEQRYTHSPPINLCTPNLQREPQQKRAHLFEVKVSINKL